MKKTGDKKKKRKEEEKNRKTIHTVVLTLRHVQRRLSAVNTNVSVF